MSLSGVLNGRSEQIEYKSNINENDAEHPFNVVFLDIHEKLFGRDFKGEYSEQHIKFVSNQLVRQVNLAADWLEQSNEISNFTYELREVNKQHLAAFVAAVTDISIDQSTSYIEELRNDQDVKTHYTAALSTTTVKADPIPLFGRRLGWYALTRALKPRLIVETGVHFGLGALAFTAALQRNAANGYPGRYIGFEMLPRFGWLLCGQYAEFGEVRYGKSLDLMPDIEGLVDFFIHDSDHSHDYERSELHLIEQKLSEQAVLMSDNTYTSPVLFEYAAKTGRNFLHFEEQSRFHFYPGAGFGIAWRPKLI